MADGYIEQKMEEHRAGRNSSYHHTPSSASRASRPGEWVMTFKPCQVIIEDIEQKDCLEIGRQLIAIGFKVCFRHPDIHRGQKLASTIGGRLLPPGMDADPGAISINHEAPDMINLRRYESAIQIRLDSDFAREMPVFAAIHLANTLIDM